MEECTYDRSELIHNVSLFDLHHKYVDVRSQHYRIVVDVAQVTISEAMKAPEGFIRVLHAQGQLATGMWGGLKRALPVRAIKKADSKLSVRYGPWREEAGRRIRAAAIEGDLVIYVVSQLPRRPAKRQRGTQPVLVPVEVLKRLMTSRGTFTDRPIRPTIKTTGGDAELLALLTDGILVVRADEFSAWYRRERDKGRWPSQHDSEQPRVGRPSKGLEPIRNAIIARVTDKSWTPNKGIAALHRLLVRDGRDDVPSPDTLARLVTRLHQETGDLDLLRTQRRRRKR